MGVSKVQPKPVAPVAQKPVAAAKSTTSTIAKAAVAITVLAASATAVAAYQYLNAPVPVAVVVEPSYLEQGLDILANNKLVAGAVGAVAAVAAVAAKVVYSRRQFELAEAARLLAEQPHLAHLVQNILPGAALQRQFGIELIPLE